MRAEIVEPRLERRHQRLRSGDDVVTVVRSRALREQAAVAGPGLRRRSFDATRATTERWRRRRAERQPDSSPLGRGSLPSRDSPPGTCRQQADERGRQRANLHREARFEEKPTSPRKPRAVALSYGSYLKVDELLGLQQPLSQPRASRRDALHHHPSGLRAVVQAALARSRRDDASAIDRDDLLRVAKHFRRIHAIQRLIEQQVDMLETMTPQEFNQFRDHLNPASGFQSVQFRELEFACGLRRTEVLKWIELDDAQRARLERRSREPSLYDRVKALLRRRGFAVGFERGADRELSARSTRTRPRTTTCICCSRI